MGTKKTDENRKKVSWRFSISVFILSQVFNDINDNYKVKSLRKLSLQIKCKCISVYINNKKKEKYLHHITKRIFSL